MNTYRALTAAAVAAFEDGVFERDFSPTEERDWLDSGVLELVPRTYRVLSSNFAAGEQGSEIEAAYPVEVEQALLQGGHLERVEAPAEEEDAGEVDDSEDEAPPADV
jgi:uncharacterized lipoprotein YddW (UPF0748 family)